MKKVAFIDFHGTIAYKSYSDTLQEVLNEIHPDNLTTQSNFRDLLDGSYFWDSPEVAHTEYNKPKDWWAHTQKMLMNAYRELGYEDDAKELTNRFRVLYTDPLQYQIYPDTEQGLEQIKEMGWKIVVLSNHMPELKRVIKKMPMGKYISNVISSAIVGYEKPNTKFYEYALKKYNYPKKCIMLGDSILADIQGATSVDIPAILVRNSLFKDSCEFFAKDLIEAAYLISKNF